MPFLLNPYGRMVAISDNKQYEQFLKTPGFTKPTIEQEREHVKERMAMVNKMKNVEVADKGIYFSTVSKGGKDGYSIAGTLLMRELDKLGVICRPYYTGQKVAILFHNPYSITRIEAPYRIIYTMFESDKIPDDWVDYLLAADKVIVPSKWCKNIFGKAGVIAEAIPLGYDDTLFIYKARDNKAKLNQAYTFLHYNAFNIRKGFPEVFRAFTKEFRKDEPVKMIFKTTLEQIPLPITTREYPNIEIITGKANDKELLDIIHRSDCFVFPSRGEGFGITPLEAMATGMPAIVPNAHGITEYFNKDFMYEVKVKEKCPALYSRYKNINVGLMDVCDVDDLAKKMRYCYEHQDEAINMGERAAEYVKKWGISKTAIKLKALYDEVIIKPLPERKLLNVLTLEKIR